MFSEQDSYPRFECNKFNSIIKVTVFLHTASCSMVEIDRRFRGNCCLHQGNSYAKVN
jgi:polyphosphate kinase